MAQTAATEAASARLLRRSALAGLVLVAICFVSIAASRSSGNEIWQTRYLAVIQDMRLLALCFGVIVAAILAAQFKCGALRLPKALVALLALAVTSLCYAGHRLVLRGYDLVRDEQMVAFDAFVYAHGKLVWPFPAPWRDEAAALNLVFMYPVDRPVAWISSYLPGNALLHALVGLVTDPGLTAPILAGLCVPVLWSIARRLWPKDAEAPLVALLLLVVSGQFLITAMTTWAMTAHLFFNLVWLRLFLSGRRGTDLAALAVGFFATGLHQPLFHPLFVLPFGLLLLARREWARAVLFGAGYALVGLFWLAWPHWIEALVAGPGSQLASNGTDFVNRAGATISQNADNLAIMGGNLLRFVTWQNIAMLPLLLAAVPVLRRIPIAAALAGGVVLPIVVITVLLPWQGYGFGYRYLHPVLGNAALLGVYGWRQLAPLHERLRPALLAASAGGLLVLVPVQSWFAHGMVEANAVASRTIDASGADYALLNPSDGFGYSNIVHNRPDLGNRPVRIQANLVRDHRRLAARICRPGVRIAMASDAFYRPNADHFGLPPSNLAAATQKRLRPTYEAAGCAVMVLR